MNTARKWVAGLAIAAAAALLAAPLVPVDTENPPVHASPRWDSPQACAGRSERIERTVRRKITDPSHQAAPGGQLFRRTV